MINTDQLLRDALHRIKHEAASLADAQVIALEALTQAAQPAEGAEVPLNIIRYWPDRFADELEKMWLGLVGYIPNYKLHDLQRLLAKHGFTMKVYEGAAPAASQKQAQQTSTVTYCAACDGVACGGPLCGHSPKQQPSDVVSVCPLKDSVCGDRPDAWCDACPKQPAKPQPMSAAHTREWGEVVNVAKLGVQGRVPVQPLTLLAVNERLSRVPEIDYEALIAAAAVSNKTWTPGKTGCVAYARGAQWFRLQVLGHLGLTTQADQPLRN